VVFRGRTRNEPTPSQSPRRVVRTPSVHGCCFESRVVDWEVETVPVLSASIGAGKMGVQQAAAGAVSHRPRCSATTDEFAGSGSVSSRGSRTSRWEPFRSDLSRASGAFRGAEEVNFAKDGSNRELARTHTRAVSERTWKPQRGGSARGCGCGWRLEERVPPTSARSPPATLDGPHRRNATTPREPRSVECNERTSARR
jgi:hypothetical protein